MLQADFSVFPLGSNTNIPLKKLLKHFFIIFDIFRVLECASISLKKWKGGVSVVHFIFSIIKITLLTIELLEKELVYNSTINKTDETLLKTGGV